jgi:hypothetical protein
LSGECAAHRTGSRRGSSRAFGVGLRFGR